MNHQRLFSNHQRLFSAAIAVICLATPVQAGLFDFMFQGQQQPMEAPPPAYLPPFEMSQPKRHAAPRRRVIIVHKDSHEKAAALPGKAASFMTDETLRDGDAVMTEKGIRIFAGGISDEHHPKDFATLDETKGLSPSERAVLTEIDAQRSVDAKQTDTHADEKMATGRSVVSDNAHAWKWVRDPKGVLVRYVGP